MRLTDEMKEMVERLRLCYIATVTTDGNPNLSPKGRCSRCSVCLQRPH